MKRKEQKEENITNRKNSINSKLKLINENKRTEEKKEKMTAEKNIKKQKWRKIISFYLDELEHQYEVKKIKETNINRNKT